MSDGKGKCPECGHEVDVCYVCGRYEKMLTPHTYCGKVIYLCHHHENNLQKMIKEDIIKIEEKYIDEL